MLEPAWVLVVISVGALLVNTGISISTLRSIKTTVDKLDEAREDHSARITKLEVQMAAFKRR